MSSSSDVEVIDGEASRGEASPTRSSCDSSPHGHAKTFRGEDMARSLLVGDWLYWPSLLFRTERLREIDFRDDLPIILDLALLIDIAFAGGALRYEPGSRSRTGATTRACRRRRSSTARASTTSGRTTATARSRRHAAGAALAARRGGGSCRDCTVSPCCPLLCAAVHPPPGEPHSHSRSAEGREARRRRHAVRCGRIPRLRGGRLVRDHLDDESDDAGTVRAIAMPVEPSIGRRRAPIVRSAATSHPTRLAVCRRAEMSAGLVTDIGCDESGAQHDDGRHPARDLESSGGHPANDRRADEIRRPPGPHHAEERRARIRRSRAIADAPAPEHRRDQEALQGDDGNDDGSTGQVIVRRRAPTSRGDCQPP